VAKEGGCFVPVCAFGPGKGCQTRSIAGVDLPTLAQQERDRSDLPPLGRPGEERSPICTRRIHIEAVTEKQLED